MNIMKKVTPLRSLVSACCLAVSLCSLKATAAIDITLAETDWDFVIKTQFGEGKRGRVSRDESKFIQTIQPLLSQGKYQDVATAFEQLTISDPSASLLELKGQVLLNLKRYDEAEQALSTALKELPGLAAAHRSLSLVYLLTEKLDKAREHLVKSVELGAADAQLYGQLAYVNLQTGKPVSAISAYQNALMLEPENDQWYRGLLFALIESEALDQAQKLLDEMLLDEPANPQLWLQRSQIALKKSQHIKAISSLESALTLGEDALTNLISLAKLHITDGSARRATEILSQNMVAFLTDEGRDGYQAVTSIASYLAAKQDWQNLQQLLQSAQQQTRTLSADQQAGLNVFQAKLALAQNKQKEATRLLRDVVKQLPNNGEALMSLAQLYRETKNTERAAMYYLRAEAVDGYAAQAMLGRAQLFINQRQYNEALTLLRKVYKSNPSRTDLLANIQSLENLLRNTI